MTGGGGKDGSDSSGETPSFADLAHEIDALEPLAPGPRTAPGIPEPGGQDADPTPTPPGHALHFPNPDEPLLGRHSSIRQREFARLRRGNLRYRLKIDLHGEKLPSSVMTERLMSFSDMSSLLAWTRTASEMAELRVRASGRTMWDLSYLPY